MAHLHHQNNTTSIVDISEIDDDDQELVENGEGLHTQQRTGGGGGTNPGLYLFHEDPSQPERGRITKLISSMRTEPSASASRSATPMVAMIEYPETGDHTGGWPSGRSTPAPPPPPTQHQQPSQSEPAKANLGTLSGVYFPCVQNIFGVILFIRMVWIVGTAGVPAAFALVFICCCVTLTTSISLSAIATNGIVPAGGSYFMISRSLGPECGGAVGTMFFLGTTVAGAMYITGAVEIMLNYLCPSWGLFGDFQRDVSILYHNIRVYGTLLLLVVGVFVWIGVRFVSKLAPIALFCVLLSIASIYLGVFINYQGRPDLVVCAVGDRLVTLKNLPYEPLNLNTAEPAQLHRQHLLMMGAEPAHLQQQQNASSPQPPPRLTDAQLSALNQFRRTNELCTYEKLRYVFCPNLDSNSQLTWQDQQAQQQQQPPPEESSSQQQHEPDHELFRRPPNMSNCDPYFRLNRDRIRVERAVPGIASGVIMDNLRPRFRNKGTFVSYDAGQPLDTPTTGAAAPTADQTKPLGYNYIFVDITTSFTILISIYFPSCTGILAGSNRSGDLADAQRSIPLGTIAAQLTTSFVYLSCIVLFGSTFNNLLIRDKFGESTGGQLAVTQIAWPHPYVILLGGLLSTLGAALQSLVGAPRILQGIAKDEVIPCFNRFAKLSDRGEPERAILFTLAIAWLAVLIGNLDFIAPILTLSLVMCYFFINLACTLHSLLGSPSWRPRFRHYHWSISTLGCLLCLFVMIVSSWLYFLVAIFLAGCIYKYIAFSGAEKEWGDGKQGLALSAARYNLLRLRTSEQHTKNWRPQVLLFCKLRPAHELEPESVRARPAPSRELQLRLAPDAGPRAPPSRPEPSAAATADEPLRVAHPKLLTFASQLKAGKGLTLVSAVIEGQFQREAQRAARARLSLQDTMQRERVKGFADVLVARSLQEGLSYQVQSAGLGGLKHNTVVVGWPLHWRRDSAALAAASARAAAAGESAGTNVNNNVNKTATPTKAHRFIELMRDAQASQNALLVVKGADGWPESVDRLGGFIDIWWIVNDGGLLMLLGHLLRQHRTWKHCQLRIFTVASQLDDGQQMRKDLAEFLYHLRIEAQVDIVEMKTSEISDYAYERTLMMEQRAEIVRRLNASGGRKQSILLEQELEGRVIRFRIRKPSLEEELAAAGVSLVQSPVGQSPSSGGGAEELGANTCAAAGGGALALAASFRPDEANVRRMQTALALNEAIQKRSKQAKLIIINLPGAPKKPSPEAESNYMEFVEIITDKLERVLLVQNGGREVITIHS